MVNDVINMLDVINDFFFKFDPCKHEQFLSYLKRDK